MDRAGGPAQLTRDAGGFHLPSLRLVAGDESAAVLFGVVACLILLSVALLVNVAYGLIILYAFPIAMSAWLLGRWIGRSERLVVLLNQRERRHRQMLETMTKVGQELVTSKRWEAIAEHSMASLARDLELDMAWMFRRGGPASAGQMSLLACNGQAPVRATTRVADGSMGLVVRTGEVLCAESVDTLRLDHPEIRPSKLEDGIQGRLVLPVFVKGSSSGAVLLGTKRPRIWTDAEIGIASAIVNQLGLAMENASAYRSTIEALVRMEEISQMKSDFLKTASHELRTPITVLMGYVDMMGDGSLGEVPEGWALPMTQLRIKVGELNRLVQMMLEASRAEGPTLQVSFACIDIKATLTDAVEAQQPEAERMGHRLTLNLPDNQLTARCDRDKLLVVLRNLVENAVKYSPGADVVEIGVASDGDAVNVWVADRGMGVPEAEKANIFDQFHRINRPDTAAIGGSGLGLFIVRQLVEVQGGQITVTDRDGGGSVFSFTLPRDPTVLPGTGLVAKMDGAPGRRRNEASLVG